MTTFCEDKALSMNLHKNSKWTLNEPYTNPKWTPNKYFGNKPTKSTCKKVFNEALRLLDW